MAAATQDWVTLGRLSFPRTAQVAAKNTEVFVFQGKFEESTPVTIKRLKPHVFSLDKKRMRMVNHPNIVHHYCMEQDENFM